MELGCSKKKHGELEIQRSLHSAGQSFGLIVNRLMIAGGDAQLLKIENDCENHTKSPMKKTAGLGVNFFSG